MLIPPCIFVFDALLGSAWDKRRQFTMPGSIQEEKQNLVTQGRDYQAISVRGDPKITEFKGSVVDRMDLITPSGGCRARAAFMRSCPNLTTLPMLSGNNLNA